MENFMQNVTNVGKQPGQNLLQWQGKQTARKQANSEAVCSWIFRWGWTTTQILSRLLDLKRPNIADEFAKRGLLEKLVVPPGYREKYVYILAQPGLDLAEQFLDEFGDYLKTAPYTLHVSRRVSWSIHRHNMIAQHTVLDLLGSRPDQIAYATEPEYRHDGCGVNDEAIPDFSITDGETTILGEIEMNHKPDLRFKRWLWLRVKYLKAHPDVTATIFTPLNSVASALGDLLAQRQIYEVEKGVLSGKLFEHRDRMGIEMTQDLRERIQVRMLVKDLSRRTGGLTIEL